MRYGTAAATQSSRRVSPEGLSAAQILVEIRRSAAGIVDGSEDPYWAANRLQGIAVDGLTEHTPAGERCTDLYLILAGLGDRFELGPLSERPDVQATIRQFTREWLEVADDPARLQRVLEYWRYKREDDAGPDD